MKTLHERRALLCMTWDGRDEAAGRSLASRFYTRRLRGIPTAQINSEDDLVESFSPAAGTADEKPVETVVRHI
jgi:hypothetical protein